MDLELRHLRAICAIADAGSISKAATVLGLSQPGLTAQLQRVERAMGAPLFERGPHGVTATAVGDFVIARARGTLLGVEELRRGVERFPGAKAAVVTVGAAAGSVSVGFTERLTASLPEAEIRLHMELSPRVLWNLVVGGRLDAASLVDYPGYELVQTPDVAYEVIAVEPVFVLMSEQDSLAHRGEIELSELADRDWASTPPDGAGWPGCFQLACEEAGFTPRVLYTSPHCESIRELVISGRAVSACQATHPGGDGTVVRPLAGTPVSFRHILAWRREGPLARHVSEMVRLGRAAYWEYASRSDCYLAWLDQQTEWPRYQPE